MIKHGDQRDLCPNHLSDVADEELTNGEMIWETHTEVPAEEIVAELYRRQGIDALD